MAKKNTEHVRLDGNMAIVMGKKTLAMKFAIPDTPVMTTRVMRIALEHQEVLDFLQRAYLI